MQRAGELGGTPGTLERFGATLKNYGVLRVLGGPLEHFGVFRVLWSNNARADVRMGTLRTLIDAIDRFAFRSFVRSFASRSAVAVNRYNRSVRFVALPVASARTHFIM